MERWRRFVKGRAATVIAAGVLSAIMAATGVVAGGQFLKKGTYKKNEGIFSAFKASVPNLPDSTAEIARLDNLPRGDYFVIATMNTGNATDPAASVVCSLNPPGASTTEVGWTQAGGGQNPMSLSTVLTLRSRGAVSLQCADGGGFSSSVSQIRITAIRSRSLVTQISG